MPTHALNRILKARLDALASEGRLKGEETVIRGIVRSPDGRAPRYLVEGSGDIAFLRMNANAYLGMAVRREVADAEEKAIARFGTGPGAVRFISGTYEPHVALERRLAEFHGREAAILFSSAYAAVMGVIVPLATERTAVISDALNHNSIINAVTLARPGEKRIYPHLDMSELERHILEAAKTTDRAIIITDGVFSMRGDHAPLDRITALARGHDKHFSQNVVVVVDDSHGVGAFGRTGRGTEEETGSPPADLLIATLGKAFGANGGYVVANGSIIAFLRETSPFYVYSNPITPGEAAAAHRAVDLLDGPEGMALLGHLRAMTARLKTGLAQLGFETLPGQHPVVALLTRDTAKTKALVAHLRARAILATGLGFPVVPRGEEEIRFQVSADHAPADIDEVLDALSAFRPEPSRSTTRPT